MGGFSEEVSWGPGLLRAAGSKWADPEAGRGWRLSSRKAGAGAQWAMGEQHGVGPAAAGGRLVLASRSVDSTVVFTATQKGADGRSFQAPRGHSTGPSRWKRRQGSLSSSGIAVEAAGPCGPMNKTLPQTAAGRRFPVPLNLCSNGASRRGLPSLPLATLSALAWPWGFMAPATPACHRPVVQATLLPPRRHEGPRSATSFTLVPVVPRHPAPPLPHGSCARSTHQRDLVEARPGWSSTCLGTGHRGTRMFPASVSLPIFLP